MHAYKEENQRLKSRLQELENGKNGSVSSATEALTDDLRREVALLKSRIESLEKELMNQEVELKAAKTSLKDKNNDPMVKNLSQIFQQFSLHLNDLQGCQKEMDKVFQIHKTTWDLHSLQTKLDLIENHQTIFSEEIFHSLHLRPLQRVAPIKDSNNNATNAGTSINHIPKFKSTTKNAQKNENKNPIEQEVDLKKLKSEIPVNYGNQTLKRKRDVVKSPVSDAGSGGTMSIAESPTSNPSSRRLSQTTATILVSKSKTKTGLPLLMKKWEDKDDTCEY